MTSVHRCLYKFVTDVTGGPCKDHSYLLEQIHLHWGEDDSSGSEHLVNSHSFAAEVRLVTNRRRHRP